MNKDARVLVAIFPETRAFFLTFDLFQKNVLNSLNADLCLCVKNDEKEILDNPFYRAAKYKFIYPEPLDWSDRNNWGKALDFAQRVEGSKFNWRKLLSIKSMWLFSTCGRKTTPPNTFNSPTILLFFRWYLKIKLLEEKLIDQYDWFIITRSDFIHQIPHIPMCLLDENYIWIPDGEDWGGLTDRHMVVSRRYISDVLSVTDPIIKTPNELFVKMKGASNWNIERYLKLVFDERGLMSKVRRFPYTMYLVRSDEMREGWRRGQFSSRYNYFIKYLNEYKSFFLANKFIKKQADWNKSNIEKANALISLERMFYKAIHKSESSNLLERKAKKICRAFWDRAWPSYLNRGVLGFLVIWIFVTCARIHQAIFYRQKKQKSSL